MTIGLEETSNVIETAQKNLKEEENHKKEAAKKLRQRNFVRKPRTTHQERNSRAKNHSERRKETSRKREERNSKRKIWTRKTWTQIWTNGGLKKILRCARSYSTMSSTTTCRRLRSSDSKRPPMVPKLKRTMSQWRPTSEQPRCFDCRDEAMVSGSQAPPFEIPARDSVCVIAQWCTVFN